MPNKEKILVTGGTGFIGNAVVPELVQRGWDVTVLMRNMPSVCYPGVRYVSMDLFDRGALDVFLKENAFSHLIHLAWFVGPKCHVSPINLDWVEGSLFLLKKFVEYGGTTFLATGTVSEYDFSYGYLQEGRTPLTNPCFQGKCKSSFLEIAQGYAKSFNVRFKWARLFNPYGPFERPTRLVSSVIRSALKGEEIKVSDCLALMDYLHVNDTAKGIVCFLESTAEGEMNICSGVPVRLRTIVETILERTRFQGKILWGALPSATDANFIVGNNHRLLKDAGWCQTLSLDQGIQQTIEWWRKQDVLQ